MSSKSSYDEDTLPRACEKLAALIDKKLGVPEIILDLSGEMLEVHHSVLFTEFTAADVSDFFCHKYDDTKRFGGPNLDRRTAVVVGIVAYCYGFHYDGIKGFQRCTSPQTS
jgi:hypothetical protein